MSKLFDPKPLSLDTPQRLSESSNQLEFGQSIESNFTHPQGAKSPFTPRLRQGLEGVAHPLLIQVMLYPTSK